MFKPNKQLGQNFLINEIIADQIIDAASLTKDDAVLEIGPGTGILTERLVKTAGQVLAVEKDYDLSTKLQNQYKNTKSIKIIHQDILWFDPFSLSKFKIVANIPYNITSPLIRKFLENEPRPEVMILMVQREVAERICAKAGNRDRGLLTLIVEFYADAEILFEVSRNEFFPVPQVDSAVIKIIPKDQETLRRQDIEPALFFRVVKAGFSSKRQQIHNSLSGTLRLPKDKVLELLKKAQIDEKMRAEDLTFEDWRNLAVLVQKMG